MQLNFQASAKLDRLKCHHLLLLSPTYATELGWINNSLQELPTKDGKQLRLRVNYLPGLAEKAIVSKSIYSRLELNPSYYKACLGCDPEFLLVDKLGRICRADSFLPYSGPIGSDGPLGELRPNPSPHPEDVVGNLRKLVRSLPEQIAGRFGDSKILSPEAHSEKGNFALGFHVHMQVPTVLLRAPYKERNRTLTGLAQALDCLVGVPALLMEDNSNRRLGDGMYGKASDWRVSSYTFEYRTPGGFFLRHPDYALGLLSLGAVAGYSLLSWAAQKSKNWKDLGKFPNYNEIKTAFSLPNYSEIKCIFESPNKHLAGKMLPSIADNFKKLEFFDKYKSGVQLYWKLLAENKQHSPQILQNW